MRLSSALLLSLFQFFLPPTLIGLAYIYTYPIVLQCGFPVAAPAEAACYLEGVPKPAVAAVTAPFRLLALADPQLEGDSSLPDPKAPWFPSLGKWYGRDLKTLERVIEGVVMVDVPRILHGWRKRLDLWGNDLYLAHIYRMVSWWTEPTHTVVLGDLLGSQWIGDKEFAKRSTRFWKKVFRGGEKVPRSITDVSGKVEVLGKDEAWTKRIIAVAGNHDIGYAGDIVRRRIERFEDTFGGVNWNIRFRLGNASSRSRATTSPLTPTPFESAPELHVIILNSMNLDFPAYAPDLQHQSLDFLSSQLQHTSDTSKTGTILLTHIPFHKSEGICTDTPLFSYFPANQGGGIKEQNHLSEATSASILEGLLEGKTGNAIVLNGHDHEGCDTRHYRQPSITNPDQDPEDHTTVDGGWAAQPFNPSPNPFAQEPSASTPSAPAPGGSLREITVRSMMGSYSGNAGLLSAWFDDAQGKWEFAYDTCPLGVQHIWWGVHITALVELGVLVVGVGLGVWEGWAGGDEDRPDETEVRGKVKAA